jgi:hypothetical protein
MPTTEPLRQGVFTSVPELIAANGDRATHHGTEPKPSISTSSA